MADNSSKNLVKRPRTGNADRKENIEVVQNFSIDALPWDVSFLLINLIKLLIVTDQLD